MELHEIYPQEAEELCRSLNIERSLTQAQRDAIDADDFAGPHHSFPIDSQEHLDAAARLIGHAEDPEAVKRKAIAIAKRKGFTLPEAWQEKDDSQDRAVEAITPESLSVYLPITRYDGATREVHGQATIEQPDSYGTIFGFYPEAWTKWRGNMREQHDPKKAVGKAFKVESDPQERAIYVTSRVSRGAQDTWLKIEDGVLSGYSASIIPDAEFGNDPRRWPKKMYNGKEYPFLPRYTVAELSYVDNPATPGCNIQIVRADGFATEVLDLEEEDAAPEPQPEPVVETSETLERAGARLSADSRATLHQMRDQAMQLCGCEECTGMASSGEDADDSMERSVLALVERALQPVYARLQGIAGSLARSNANPNTSIENLVTSAITRAVEAANATYKSSLDEVRADLSAVKGQVDKIAETPVPGAPVMNAGSLPRPVDKRLPTDPYTPQQRSGSSVYDAVAALSHAGHLDTVDKQVSAVATALAAQRGR